MSFMRLLVIIAVTWSAAAAVMIRSGCDKDDSTIATVSDDTPIRVRSAIAGSSVCYSISAVVGQQEIDGYTIDCTLPAVVAFEDERRAAFRKATTEVARSPVAATPQAAPPPGSRFPDFATRDLSGKPVILSGGKSKVIVVAFWSPSNPRSLAQMTGLRGLYAEFHRAGLNAIGVAMTRSEAAARAALEDTDLDWPQISDQMGLARSLNIGNFEAKTLVLDANHNIIASDLHGPELTALVSKMLRSR
jgi:peroxiredoxin